MKTKTKILSLLVAAILVMELMTSGVWAASNVTNYIFDISEGNITIAAGTTDGKIKVTYGNTQTTTAEFSSSSHAITITGKTKTNKITVAGNIPNEVNITLKHVSLISGTYALAIQSGSKVNLTLLSTNTLTSGGFYAGLHVPQGATLNITAASSGSIVATGGSNGGSGIGGNGGVNGSVGGLGEFSGNYINGGDGGMGGTGDTCGTVIVNGGTVVAIGDGSGIGGGRGGTGGTGGNGRFKSGSPSTLGNAGLGGSGGTGGAGGTVTINAGMVTAIGNGSGIGGGAGGKGGLGGTGGEDSNSQGTSGAGGSGGVGGALTVNGGTVTALGDVSGIGSAINGMINSGTVTIKGGSLFASSIGGNVLSESGIQEYPVTISMSGISAVTDISYKVGVGNAVSSSTDSSGQLYLWLPVIGATTTLEITAGGTVYEASGTVTTGSNSFTATATSTTTTLVMDTNSLPIGIVAAAYNATLTAHGGTAHYTWSATGLPNGLTINSSTGAISGTSTDTGTYTVAVTVTDSSSPNKTVTKNLTLNVYSSSPNIIPSITVVNGAPFSLYIYNTFGRYTGTNTTYGTLTGIANGNDTILSGTLTGVPGTLTEITLGSGKIKIKAVNPPSTTVVNPSFY